MAYVNGGIVSRPILATVQWQPQTTTRAASSSHARPAGDRAQAATSTGRGRFPRSRWPTAGPAGTALMTRSS